MTVRTTYTSTYCLFKIKLDKVISGYPNFKNQILRVYCSVVTAVISYICTNVTAVSAKQFD